MALVPKFLCTFATIMEDIAIELSLLHSLSGIQFVKQLEKITQYGGFALVKGETAIYSVGGGYDGDYDALLDAAHKAVEHGNDIKAYFEANRNAVEVLLYKGKKAISVNRYVAKSSMFYRQFRKKYEQ